MWRQWVPRVGAVGTVTHLSTILFWCSTWVLSMDLLCSCHQAATAAAEVWGGLVMLAQ